ncbi:MAG: hypothetical protein K0Q49_1360 [Haloplasmataceae bacterium]|jgi:hypothetical protein|nr:hypothetical protein [Haloplasmataceae bacterium]
MENFIIESGRIKLIMKVNPIGDDLCINIFGGDTPHIGCITLSVPRPSLSNANMTSATTSVLNLTGHKDDEAARYVSHTLAAKLNKNVVVTCGIHVDQITVDEIKMITELLKQLTDQVISEF